MASARPTLAARVFDTDRRRSDREEVALETLLITRVGQTIAISILNLSEHGLMAVTDEPLCEREPVRIDLPTIGWLRADIVWALGERIGASFRAPIDPAIFATFLRSFA